MITPYTSAITHRVDDKTFVWHMPHQSVIVPQGKKRLFSFPGSVVKLIIDEHNDVFRYEYNAERGGTKFTFYFNMIREYESRP